MIKLIISLFLSLLCTQAKAFGCLQHMFTFYDNQTSKAYFKFRKNGACLISMSGHKVDTYKKLTITRKPANGIAGVATEVKWGYEANKNFVGVDSFQIQVEWTHLGRDNKGWIDVSVTVTE